MLKQISLFLPGIAIVILLQAMFRPGFSNRSGAPAGRTGSPFDNGGVACNASGCHTGSPVTNVSGWITSNIPVNGYVPLSTYTITATATSSGLVRFGFEISPQTSTGLLAGTNVITDAVNTRLAPTNNPKYVTQTTTGSGTATSGSRTWTFDWIAPAAGTGNVTFYGAFNCANNSGNSAGDLIRLCTLSVAEDFTSSMIIASSNNYSVDVYPNPASGLINISVNGSQPMIYHAHLIDVTGKEAKSFETANVSANMSHTSLLNLDGVGPGIYFLQIVSEGSVTTKKIAVF